MTEPNTLALEGTSHHQEQTQSNMFLIIPGGRLTPSQTNTALLLEEIKKLSSTADLSQFEKHSRPPSGSKKIIALPQNDIQLEIDANHPKAYLYVLLPFAVVVDIVGFPFEYYYLLSHWKC